MIILELSKILNQVKKIYLLHLENWSRVAPSQSGTGAPDKMAPPVVRGGALKTPTYLVLRGSENPEKQMILKIARKSRKNRQKGALGGKFF